jgi:hypothetical protein
MDERNLVSEKPKIDKVIEAMKRRGIEAQYAKNKEAANSLILGMITPDWIIGCGDSATIRSLGILQELEDRGHRVLNPFRMPKIPRDNPTPTPLKNIKQAVFGSDVFMLSANAVTLDGRIINCDGGGFRAAGTFWGPDHISLLVVGRNKIAKDVEDGLYRIKEIIWPVHHRTNRKENPPEFYLPIDPVKCKKEIQEMEPESDSWCGSPRIGGSNITVIVEGRPGMPDIRIVVILVDEDLGLGWDPSWPQERKDKIFLEYQKFTPPHRPVANRVKTVKNR